MAGRVAAMVAAAAAAYEAAPAAPAVVPGRGRFCERESSKIVWIIIIGYK